jgi:hypothetical protein
MKPNCWNSPEARLIRASTASAMESTGTSRCGHSTPWYFCPSRWTRARTPYRKPWMNALVYFL